jgi:hypothetical protein
MKTADCTILMVPGRYEPGDEHWQTRWQSRLSTARRVGVNGVTATGPVRVDDIVDAVRGHQRPVIMIAHSFGVVASVIAAHALFKPDGRERTASALKGLFLVAPAGSRSVLESDDVDHALAHPPLTHLPVPSVVIASRNDPHCPFLEAEEWAHAWGASFVDAGDSGHIDVASGHGPWPEGLMRFAGFLQTL